MDAQLERRASPGARPERPFEVVRERRGWRGAERRQRVAGGDRVGGVGLDQQLRPVAAEQVARKAGRDGDREQDLAAVQQPVDLLAAAGDPDDPVVAGVLQRRDEAAGEVAVVIGQDDGRQVLGVAVDGVAEQEELDDRDADHHGEGQPVPLIWMNSFRIIASRREKENRPAGHAALSSACAMRWMNTSSSVGSIGARRAAAIARQGAIAASSAAARRCR